MKTRAIISVARRAGAPVWKRSLGASAAFAFCMFGHMGAQAGFIDDFYNDAGAFSSSTSAGVTQGMGGTLLSGGSLMVRNRNSAFKPYYLSPPDLKMGCGGIDLFLGAIGVASKAEFIAFLKQIGQQSTVLAFQLALKMISPELMAALDNLKSMMDQVNSRNMDSCEASKRLVAGAADYAIESGMFDSVGDNREKGGTSDHESSKERFARSTKEVTGYPINTKKVEVQADGTTTSVVVPKVIESNLVWTALSEAFPTMDHEDKQLLMSVTGTVVMKKVPNADGSASEGLAAIPYLATASIKDFIGQTPSTPISFAAMKCPAAPTDCLEPGQDPTPRLFMQNLWGKVQGAADRYANLLAARDATPLAAADAGMLVASPVPLVRAINVLSSSVYRAASSDILSSLTQMAAYDLAAQALGRAVAVTSSSVVSREGVELNAGNRKLLEDLKEDMQKKSLVLADIRKEIWTISAGMTQQLILLDNFEKAFRNSTSKALAANLSFNR